MTRFAPMNKTLFNEAFRYPNTLEPNTLMPCLSHLKTTPRCDIGLRDTNNPKLTSWNCMKLD